MALSPGAWKAWMAAHLHLILAILFTHTGLFIKWSAHHAVLASDQILLRLDTYL